MAKIKKYNIDRIDNTNSIINLIMGGRADGKSYQLKHKKMVEYYLNTKRRFGLIRRYKDEITNNKIIQYFSDVDVEKLTNGIYNCITVYKREIFLSIQNEDFTIKRGEKIGYVFVLSQEQTYAGINILDIDNLIFEEFFSRSLYLTNEADKLMNLYNTIDRKRNVVRLWLAGNTISRTNPVLRDWGIFDLIKDMRQGDIQIKHLTVQSEDEEARDFTLAIEYCKSTGEHTFDLSNNSGMINTGAWQASPEPHLSMSHKTYKLEMRVLFIYKKFMFIGELLSKKNEVAWFIYPKYSAVKENNHAIIFTDEPSPARNVQSNIYDIKHYPSFIKHLFIKTFVKSKIFFATDLCGNEFKDCINFTIRQ